MKWRQKVIARRRAELPGYNAAMKILFLYLSEQPDASEPNFGRLEDAILSLLTQRKIHTAVWMYQKITGVGLAEAMNAVKGIERGDYRQSDVIGIEQVSYLKQHSYTVIAPWLPDDDFEEAVRIAQARFDQHQPNVVVGSSRGGAVAMNIECGETPLVLLCPAWKRWGVATAVKLNTVILHSRADYVVPIADSEELVKCCGLPASALIEVKIDDHQLCDPESLAELLKACWRPK